MLVELIEARAIAPGRSTLEIGCGTGTNAIYLSQHGFEVIGIDISPLAVEIARKKARGCCRFAAFDFLEQVQPDGPYQFVFDRGCFQTFDEHQDRARFAARVAAVLEPGGLWVSLIGSTEGAPRETGPPRRSAHDVISAVEPSLEIVDLCSRQFEVHGAPVTAWRCLARRRIEPAQPSSRH